MMDDRMVLRVIWPILS